MEGSLSLFGEQSEAGSLSSELQRLVSTSELYRMLEISRGPDDIASPQIDDRSRSWLKPENNSQVRRLPHAAKAR